VKISMAHRAMASTILAVRDEFVRRLIRSSMFASAAGMAVSGAALTVGSLGAAALFARGSLAASLFVVITVLLSAIAVGRALSFSIIRTLADLQPSLPATPDVAANLERHG